MAMFALGFFLGRWLHSLAPSISDALSAAWDWLTHLFTGRRGDTFAAAHSCQPGQSVVDGECQWPVIDVYPDSGVA